MLGGGRKLLAMKFNVSLAAKKNMTRMRRGLLQAFVLSFILNNAVAGLSSFAHVDTANSSEAFTIRFRSIDVPVGRIVLFRVRDEFCALRIRGYGAAVIDSSDVKNADYDLLRAPAGQLALNEKGRATGRFEFKGYVGLGHWVWERGNTVLKCGGQRIGWSYPNKFELVGDANISVAPTAWTSFSDVILNDPTLQWFEEDKSQKRGELKLPVESLPGFVSKGGARPDIQARHEAGGLGSGAGVS